MRLSLRSRILLTYGVLVIMIFLILALGFLRLRRIGSKLEVIQSGYLPIAKTVNSLLNFYHLDETFDVPKIIANQNNRLFVDSVTLHNPVLMESGIKRSMDDARVVLTRSPGSEEAHTFQRIVDLIDDLMKQHRTYTTQIRSILDMVQRGDTDTALQNNPDLVRQKRLVRSRLDFLSARLDERINRSIHSTVEEERKAVYLTLGLAIGALVLGLLMGGLTLASLRPLDQLKNAAREIAAGDLKQRVVIKSHDEVGDLAREFNRMADAIRERDEALRKQQEQLLQSEKMAVIGRMASKISHEIRNPLNALSLNLEMLADENLKAEAREALKATSTEIDRLNRIAESYLTLARSPKQATEDIDLKKIVSQIDRLIRPETDRRSLVLRATMDEILPLLRFNASRLEQALLNLLRNAMEASTPNGLIQLAVRKEPDSVVIEVSDQGKGIPADALPHIYEPFYTTKEKGTGLGLAITSEIIAEQGGSIDCRSEVGRGTTFLIRIPVKTNAV